MSIRSRMTEEQLVSRAVEPVVTRTVRLLLALHQEGSAADGPSAPAKALGREEMALLVGTTREILSRTLHDLAGWRFIPWSRLTSQLLPRHTWWSAGVLDRPIQQVAHLCPE